MAMQLAKKAGVAPRELAAALAEELSSRPGIKSVEIAGPGFLNIRLDAAAAGVLARDVVLAGPEYGRTDRLAGQRINLEFVSANPTGPVHIGGVRWAAVGDALSRLLRAFGHDVRTADTVAGAVRAVEAHAFDLLISDIGLPDGTGLDLMRQVRARSGLRGIVLSGFGTEDEVRRSREAGFDDHLTKPVNLDTLKQAISQSAER